jgi:hypothetical protein
MFWELRKILGCYEEQWRRNGEFSRFEELGGPTLRGPRWTDHIFLLLSFWNRIKRRFNAEIQFIHNCGRIEVSWGSLILNWGVLPWIGARPKVPGPQQPCYVARNERPAQWLWRHVVTSQCRLHVSKCIRKIRLQWKEKCQEKSVLSFIKNVRIVYESRESQLQYHLWIDKFAIRWKVSICKWIFDNLINVLTL